MIIAETQHGARVTAPHGEGDCEPATIELPGGETLVVYVKVWRDSTSGTVVAADPTVRDAHGNPISTRDAYLRSKRRVLVDTDRSGEVCIV